MNNHAHHWRSLDDFEDEDNLTSYKNHGSFSLQERLDAYN